MTKTRLSKQAYSTRKDAARVVKDLQPTYTDPNPANHVTLGVVRVGEWFHISYTSEVTD